MSGNVNLSEASLIDNIFEGRNKSYGAYELRTNSSKRTVLALIFSSIFFIGLVFVLYLSMKSKDKEETKITKVELKKVKTPIKKEEKKILEQKKVEPIKKVKSVFVSESQNTILVVEPLDLYVIVFLKNKHIVSEPIYVIETSVYI
jgi:protein TonB